MTIAVVAATLLFVAPLHAQLTIAVPANQEWVDAGMEAVGPPELAQAPPTQHLRMPDLRKHTLNDAFEILSRYHRRPRVEQGPSALTKGLVFDQEPPPGTDLSTVREIVLHVSDGSRPASTPRSAASVMAMTTPSPSRRSACSRPRRSTAEPAASSRTTPSPTPGGSTQRSLADPSSQ